MTTELDTPTLIPRATLFGNPERGACRISPDGRWLAYNAPRDGVMNLWVCPRDDLAAARPVTDDRVRGVRQFEWAYDGVHLLYQQDEGGDENFHLFAVRVDDGTLRDLTPYPGVRGLMQALSRQHRDEVLITLNRRDARFADLWRVTIASGEMRLVQENPGLVGFITDDRFRVRIALAPTPEGGWAWLKADAHGALTLWQSVAVADAMTTAPLHIDADGRTLYARDSRSRDTAALVAFDIDAAAPLARVMASHTRADVTEVLTDAQSHAPLACAFDLERRELQIIDESVRADVAFLDAQSLGEWSVASQTEDDRCWIVRATSDTNPASVQLYDRDTRRLRLLYDCMPALAGLPLSRMEPATIRSRDGLPLVAYLTRPVGATQAALPLVLLVHGGPWARDSWGFNPYHQWLANRGYAVLSVNFRSSTGFGKAFVNAGDLQWGAKMDDDLRDAVDWAVAQGVADPARVAIMGGSYGGYAVLWGLVSDPERYACGVDIVGPSNLETLMAAIPPQWEAGRAMLYRQVGNPGTAEGLALLKDRSPLHRAAAIRRPLLIGQGANDPRVKQAEADQMAAAMKANGIPVTYVLFPDEGHGFQRPANSIAFNAITERFLARYLGGRHEPVGATEIDGHTALMVEDSLA
jgi:dipeptidyl aminopeptidase/acylaminoacyl peptidase